jgi:hypothetical protein
MTQKIHPPCLGNATEESIGEIVLFTFVDPRGITHYRAIGRRNWTCAGSSSNAVELLAEARRICIRKNAEYQSLGPDDDWCCKECDEYDD